MTVLIVEDEITAAERLESMLSAMTDDLKVLAKIQSVDETVHWLANNPQPDLAFFDIQLADDISFEIFKKVEINFPVIFTTAYDEFILEALEHNSIDYLLKPLQEERLKKAMDKVKKLESHFVQHRLGDLFDKKFDAPKKRTRLLVKKGIDYISITTKNVAYFFTEHKLVFLKDREGSKYIIDKTLSELAEELDHTYFFRANRKYLVHIDAIERFKSDNGKIVLQLSPMASEEVSVSKENAPNFRKWIDR